MANDLALYCFPMSHKRTLYLYVSKELNVQNNHSLQNKRTQMIIILNLHSKDILYKLAQNSKYFLKEVINKLIVCDNLKTYSVLFSFS